MKNGNGNLRSLAQTLSSKHRRNLEPNKNVTFTNENPAFKLRPGRHRCDCQARIHSLIRNCLSCGRIVCAQEGSGPCFCCGELVCTREEREILNRNSKKSLELFNRLMGGTVHSQDQGTSSRTSLAKLGDALSKAEEFRDRLLQADAEREKQTRVNDLEADYYSMESDVYLTQEEREAIKARKEELKEMREKRKRTMLINLDLQNMQATEVQQKDTITGHDPVIQTILKKSQQRHSGGRKASEGHWVPSSFVPMYDESIGRKHTNTDSYDVNFAEDVMNFTNDEIMYAEVERKGLAIAFDQPFASLLSCGCRR
ncbi:hypothetical protein AB6A40_005741 [Gnathostoma spinigerum]|uniref:Zinc finger C2HC5-type domain-containing protein n=1 Tax=Gnathostoma spinigerum TaxID=75299 RepID=A0ABD6EII7_9BILA